MDPDEDGFTIRGNWSAPGARSIVGRYRLADFGAPRGRAAGRRACRWSSTTSCAELAPARGRDLPGHRHRRHDLHAAGQGRPPDRADGGASTTGPAPGPTTTSPPSARRPSGPGPMWSGSAPRAAAARARPATAACSRPSTRASASSSSSTAPHGPLSDYVHVEANPAYERHAGIPDVVGQRVRDDGPRRGRRAGSSSTAACCAPASRSASSASWSPRAATWSSPPSGSSRPGGGRWR